MQKQPLFISLTNIPTPYRLHFYNALSKALYQKEIDFKVWFMAQSESGRHWKFNQNDFDFKFEFKPGFNPSIKNRQFYFSPHYLRLLFQQKPYLIIFSGSWFMPNVVLASFISHALGIKTIFWSESNLKYIEYKNTSANFIRKTIIDRFDHYAVPGKFAEEYIRAYAPNSSSKRIIQLPNVVNEKKIGSIRRVDGQRKEHLKNKWFPGGENLPILFIAARLEPIKGITEFLECLFDSAVYKKLILLIAGDGSQKKELNEKIKQVGAKKNIRILGFLCEKEILELLSIADAFVLPSIGDPYPLAAIEAAFAGLPLLLSNRVGCHPEILTEDWNGFLFNPKKQVSIINCVSKFLHLDKKKWIEMGKRSRKIAKERFSTMKVVKHFVNDLLTL
jgi:glycosyltransferase involved in cell wall biosynthesis